MRAECFLRSSRTPTPVMPVTATSPTYSSPTSRRGAAGCATCTGCGSRRRRRRKLPPGPTLESRQAFGALVTVRVALHAVTRRASNVLTLQDQDAVAAHLGSPDADVLMADVSGAGRTIAIAADEARSRVTSWAARGTRRGRRKPRPSARPLSAGLVAVNDEVALVPEADVAGDPSMALRAAAEAADARRARSPATRSTRSNRRPRRRRIHGHAPSSTGC